MSGKCLQTKENRKKTFLRKSYNSTITNNKNAHRREFYIQKIPKCVLMMKNVFVWLKKNNNVNS